MGKFQTAIEQLKQNDFTRLKSYPLSPPSPPSPISPATISSKRPKCNIPEDLELENVYNPKYSVFQLISTRKHPRKQVIPPRPSNSFFLFKNCYLLELRKLGYRFCMPDICRQSKQLWSNIPPDVKERYDILALQAQILHQEMYPEYKFSPKKRQAFKQKKQVFSPETTTVESSMLSTFSITNFLGDKKNDSATEYFVKSNDSELLSPPDTPLSSYSSPTISSPHELINELIIPQQTSVDFNNLLYLNNCYLNSLNNILTQSPPALSPEVSPIYSQIINPFEFLSYTDDPNALNFD
jgi:hypothetical protein